MLRGADIDKEIERELTADPHLTEKALAERIGVDRNTCHKHLLGLIRSGVIGMKGFLIKLPERPKTLGYILVKTPRKAKLRMLIAALLRDNNLGSVTDSVTGIYDYIVMTSEDIHSASVLEFISQLQKLEAETQTLAVLGAK